MTIWTDQTQLLLFGPGKSQLTTEEFPPDLDTTAIGLTVLKYDKDIVHSVMDEMLEYVSADGIIQVSILYCHVDLKPTIVAGSCIDTLHRPTLIIVDHGSTLSYASMF